MKNIDILVSRDVSNEQAEKIKKISSVEEDDINEQSTSIAFRLQQKWGDEDSKLLELHRCGNSAIANHIVCSRYEKRNNYGGEGSNHTTLRQCELLDVNSDLIKKKEMNGKEMVIINYI